MKRLVLSILALSSLCTLAALQFTPAPAAASSVSYYVSPTGNDANSGTTASSPFKTIQKAIDLAQPGAVINLAAGTYLQDLVSRRNGSATAPITITGPSNAVIKGGGNARIIEINHDYITLDGFTIDGLYGDASSANGYRDKLLYVLGKEQRNGVNGLKVLRMTFTNAGGECLRLRYFAQNNEIAYSRFSNCGVHDFRFKAGGKNGEGIYIGTAPEQLGDGRNPTTDPDQSNNNWVHHNSFNTQGNECVDIKEAASGNLIEQNTCTGQKDPESAGLDSRGNGNIFRFNEVYGSVGAGVRLGGDSSSDGINNDVYGNTLYNNQAGGIKFQRVPQGKICGNTMNNNSGGDSVGSYGDQFNPVRPCPDSTATATPVQATATATVRPSATGQPTATATRPPTATPTQPGATATPIGTTQEYLSTIDTYVSSSSPTQSYSGDNGIKVDLTPEQWSLLRFDLTGSSSARRVVLRLYVNNSSDQGGTIYMVPATWNSNVTWNTRPALGAAIATIGQVVAGSWISIDVTAALQQGNTITLAIVPLSLDAAGYRSKESGTSYTPRLLVER